MINKQRTAADLLTVSVLAGGVSLSFVLAGCSKPLEIFESESDVADTVHYPKNSEDLKLAAAEARRKWSFFEKEFIKKGSDKNISFLVKFPVSQGQTTEHLWINVTAINGPGISGTYDSDADFLPNIHRGDSAGILLKDMEDWMIDDGVTAWGGFSLQKLTPKFIREIYSLNEGESDRSRRIEDLCKYWQKLADDAEKGIETEVSQQDMSYLSTLLRQQRMQKGNAGHEANDAELAKLLDLPEKMIQSSNKFWKLQQHTFKTR